MINWPFGRKIDEAPKDLMFTILLVEDHEDTRYVLGRHFAAWGHRVLEAPNGEAGMAILAGQTPDLIIVDGMMPGMGSGAV